MIDTHVHLFDRSKNTYPFLEIPSLSFAAFYGDYSDLPESFLPTDLNDQFVAIEFGSDDPVKEAKWLGSISDTVVAKVDLLNPIELEAYAEIPQVKVVREHLLYHPVNRLKIVDAKSALMKDLDWQKAFSNLNYTFEARLYSTQLDDLISLALKFPSKRIIVSNMGWPLEGFAPWLSSMRELAKCENVAIKVCALEAVFGLDWEAEMLTPWVEHLLELFSPRRVMFGSNLPFSSLAKKSRDPFSIYQTKLVLKEFHQEVFVNTPREWYQVC